MRRVVIGTLCLLLSSVASGADEQMGGAEKASSCVDQVVAQVQSKYETVGDLSANFRQTTRSVIGGAGADGESAGRVVFAKPGRMRWSYQTPRESEVVSDGQTLWLFDAAAKQVQTLPVSEGYMAGAGLQFLLGEGDLASEFQIRPIECDAQANEMALLELTPRQPASYERLLLRARFATGEVAETTVIDLFGNRTRIAFSDLKLDQDPPADTFRFDAPADVEIIELAVPQ